MDDKPSDGYAPLEGGGLQRTELHCHECNGHFVAELDFDLSGNHEIHCPRCKHVHYRRIENGKITSDRYHSDNKPSHVVSGSSVWVGLVKKQDDGEIRGAKVTTAAHYLRERWLNRTDI